MSNNAVEHTGRGDTPTLSEVKQAIKQASDFFGNIEGLIASNKDDVYKQLRERGFKLVFDGDKIKVMKRDGSGSFNDILTLQRIKTKRKVRLKGKLIEQTIRKVKPIEGSEEKEKLEKRKKPRTELQKSEKERREARKRSGKPSQREKIFFNVEDTIPTDDEDETPKEQQATRGSSKRKRGRPRGSGKPKQDKPKRPVGRPRTKPRVEGPKRPVGRPRTKPREEGPKRPVGRPSKERKEILDQVNSLSDFKKLSYFKQQQYVKASPFKTRKEVITFFKGLK